MGWSSRRTVNSDGSEERKLAVRRAPEFYSVDGPTWSPDGNLIAVALGSSTGDFHFRVLVVRSTDGYEQPLGAQRWAWAMRVKWLSDGSGVALVEREKNSATNNQLWRLTYPDGAAQRLVTDLHDYRNLSLTADGKTLVTVQSEVRANIWVAPLNPAGQTGAAVRITSNPNSQSGYNGLDWTPDGRLVYTAQVNGQQNLWSMRSNGSQARQLTFNTVDNECPSVSGDGRYIVFTSLQSGSPRIWRIDLDGSNPKELTDDALDLKPNCSPDGRWVVYSSGRAGARSIWKISKVGIDGSPAQPLSDKLSDFPVISPDGKLIACLYQESANAPRRIVINRDVVMIRGFN